MSKALIADSSRDPIWDETFRRRVLRSALSNEEASQVVEIVEGLDEQSARYEAALRRLASSEGFEGAGMIDGESFSERELRARMRFAEETLRA